MGFISIHDTHKLPYFNATITAKTKQSGNTSPLKFKTCLDGTDLGYTVYTNARGYLCDHDGNLYTDSVCVGEDAYITATMADGASTSWIVRYESDITVNDGMLLGRTVTDSERQSLTGKTFVKVEGVWRILLHSANTAEDRTLPLGDLDEVPAFNEWKEVQEVVRFNSSFTSYDIGEYAKSLVVQWEGSLPTYPAVLTITLGYENANNRKRYAQQVMVHNTLAYNIRLKDKNTGNIIGVIPPFRSADIGLFFTDNANIGYWKFDGLNYLEWNGVRQESYGSTFTETQGKYVDITDSTPDIIHVILKEEASASGTPRIGEIPIVLQSTLGVSKPRDMIFWFTNLSTGTAAGLPAVLKTNQGRSDIAIVYSGQMVWIHVPQTSSGFTEDNNVVLMDNSLEPWNRAVRTTVNGSGQFKIPRHCDWYYMSTPGNGETIRLVFPTLHKFYTRVSIEVRGTGHTVLELVNGSDNSVQHRMLIAKAGNFGVRNCFGLLYVDDRDVQADYSYAGDGVWYADFTQHYANQIDFTRMGMTGKKFGSYSSSADNPKNDLYIKLPVKSTDNVNFEIMFNHYASHTRASARVIRFYVRTTDGVDYSITDLIDIVDSIFVNGGRYKFAKNGSSITRTY